MLTFVFLCAGEFDDLIRNLAWVMFALEISRTWAEGEQKSIFFRNYVKTGTFSTGFLN